MKLQAKLISMAIGLLLAGFLAQAQIGGGGITGGGGGGFTSGTFTVTWDQACGTNPTQTWNYMVSGNFVVLTPTQAVSCTSDSTFFITLANDVPTAIRPLTATAVNLGLMSTVNNGTNSPGCLHIETDNSLTIARGQANGLCDGNGIGGWTASGTKGFSIGSQGPANFVYNRDRD